MSEISDAVKRAKEIAARLSGQAPANQHSTRESEHVPYKATKANTIPLGKRRFDATTSETETDCGGAKKMREAGEPLFRESLQEKIYIPVEARPDIKWLGLIIGPRGSTIARIKQQSNNCTIQLRGRGSKRDGTSDDDPEALHVKLEGSREQIDIAKTLLNDLINHPDQEKYRQLDTMAVENAGVRLPSEDDPFIEMHIPNNAVGAVIGRGGEKIREIQTKSGVTIQMQREIEMKPGQTDRRLTIRGPADLFDNAKKLILAVVNEYKNPHHAQASGRNTNRGGPIVKQIKVPHRSVGAIIGRRGVTINEIQNSTQTFVSIPSTPDEDNPDYRTLGISGHSMQACDLAEEKIFNIVTENINAAINGRTSTGTRAVPPGASVVSFEVGHEHVGAIVGKRGTTIRRLEYNYQVKVDIPPDPIPGSSPPLRKVDVIGPLQNAENCKLEIARIVGQFSLADARRISGSAYPADGSNQFSRSHSPQHADPNLDPRNPYAAQWAAYYAQQAAAAANTQVQPAAETAGQAAAAQNMEVQPAVKKITSATASDATSAATPGDVPDSANQKEESASTASSDPNLDPRNPYAAQWAAYYAQQAAAAANTQVQPAAETATSVPASETAAVPPPTDNEDVNISARGGSVSTAPSDPNVDPRNPYAAQWAAYYAQQSASTKGEDVQGGTTNSNQSTLAQQQASPTAVASKTTDAADAALEEPQETQDKQNSNTLTTNDEAAETWARYYEANPAVAIEHGYTAAHYEQYLANGGVPGGAADKATK